MENKQRSIQPCAEPKQLACLHGLGKLNKEWPMGAMGNEPLSGPDVLSAPGSLGSDPGLSLEMWLKAVGYSYLLTKNDFVLLKLRDVQVWEAAEVGSPCLICMISWGDRGLEEIRGLLLLWL